MSYPQASKSYNDFKVYLRGIIQSKGAEIKEAGRLSRHIDERLAQSIWYENLLKKELTTIAGNSLEVVNPGRWNEESGPDFRAAEIKINGQPIKGDVEIHLYSSDWQAHQHHKNFEYNTTILHAFLYKNDKDNYDLLHNGQRIERLEMESFLFPDLDSIRKTISLEDYPYRTKKGVGKCSSFFLAMEPEMLRQFLSQAGKERMTTKTKRFADQLEGETLDQVFYQAIMTAMGYKGSKTLFFLLSKRAPLNEMIDYTSEAGPAERPIMIQSILLNVANLVPKKDERHPYFDDETMEYINKLYSYWAEFSGYFKDRLIPATQKWFAHVRPVNFAPRRIAGISYLLSRNLRNSQLLAPFYEQFKTQADKSLPKKAILQFIKELQEQLTVEAEEDYWSYRYLFTSRRQDRPMHLIGSNRALSMVFNSLLPMVLLKARQTSDKKAEEFAWQVFDCFPPLERNIITKFMSYRLFDDAKQTKPLLKNEGAQQALFQIFYDCCNNNELTCDDCYFYQPCLSQ